MQWLYNGRRLYVQCSNCSTYVPYLHDPFEFYWIKLYSNLSKQVQTNCYLYYDFYEKTGIISHYEDEQGYWHDF